MPNSSAIRLPSSSRSDSLQPNITVVLLISLFNRSMVMFHHSTECIGSHPFASLVQRIFRKLSIAFVDDGLTARFSSVSPHQEYPFCVL